VKRGPQNFYRRGDKKGLGGGRRGHFENQIRASVQSRKKGRGGDGATATLIEKRGGFVAGVVRLQPNRGETEIAWRGASLLNLGKKKRKKLRKVKEARLVEERRPPAPGGKKEGPGLGGISKGGKIEKKKRKELSRIWGYRNPGRKKETVK